MRFGPAFSRYRVSLTVALMFIAWAVWKAVSFSPFEQNILITRKVNHSTLLYVTEGSAGATTANVYNYYLVPATVTTDSFLRLAGDKYHSFLSTADDKAQIETDDHAMHITIKGKIYSFTNASSYSVDIYLSSQPY